MHCYLFLWIKKTNRLTYIMLFFSTWICTGVDEAGGVSNSPVSVMPFLFFFLFFLLGGSLNEQLPSLPALSLHQTPHFQL